MTSPIRRVFVYSAMLPLLLASTEGIGRAADTITHQITLPPGQSWCDDGMIVGLFNQINTFRTQNGVPALKMDALGMKDAEIRATQFIANMAANPPGSPGFNPQLGYDTTTAALGYPLISENLAYIASDPAYIVFWIWQDPLHIAAMLANDATVAGVSCVISDFTPYWTYEPGRSATGTTPVPVPPPATAPDSEEWAFLTLINNYRAQNGLSQLQVSVALENAAHWMQRYGDEKLRQPYRQPRPQSGQPARGFRIYLQPVGRKHRGRLFGRAEYVQSVVECLRSGCD